MKESSGHIIADTASMFVGRGVPAAVRWYSLPPVRRCAPCDDTSPEAMSTSRGVLAVSASGCCVFGIAKGALRSTGAKDAVYRHHRTLAVPVLSPYLGLRHFSGSSGWATFTVIDALASGHDRHHVLVLSLIVPPRLGHDTVAFIPLDFAIDLKVTPVWGLFELRWSTPICVCALSCCPPQRGAATTTVGVVGSKTVTRRYKVAPTARSSTWDLWEIP